MRAVLVIESGCCTRGEVELVRFDDIRDNLINTRR